MKLFVWDFHGVLEKDNDLAVFDISNQVLEQTGYSERFSIADVRTFYGLKWYQYFERLLPHLSHDQHLALQAACFKFSEENTHILAQHIKPSDYVHEVLAAIQAAGHDQILISNTRPSDLAWFVRAVHIDPFFPPEKLFGANAHQTHQHKKDILRQYLATTNPDGIVIIGDSVSDIELKEVAGGTTYFYNHPHVQSLPTDRADYISADLRDILREL